MEQIYVPEDPNLVEVPVFSLEVGMFVAELDRPWLETPFAMQGFVVKDDADIEYISKHCTYVYVDPEKREGFGIKMPRQVKAVKEQSTLKAEFSRAKVEFESASQAMERVFAQIEQNQKVDIPTMQKVVRPLIDSVFRNREALAALVRLKDKGDYMFQHSLATAVWAAVLGRHMGLERAALEDLALGVSVMDVGMTDVPDEILNKKGPLEPHEIVEMRAHVSNSLKLVHNNGLTNRVMNLVACHHERFDGSGYPQRLKGNEIPPLARIAGIVDTYDAMLTPRPHSRARSSFEAIQELADMKDRGFQGSLVEQFIQTVGMFPTGSIVELNTGAVGVVVEQNPARRLKPKVVLILDENKQRYNKLSLIDLSAVASWTKLQLPEMWIVQEHSRGSFDIQPDDYFI